MSLNIAWGRFAVASALIIGSGYAIMKFTTPSDQQLYNSLSPELKRKADSIRAGNQTVKDELQRRAEQASKDEAQGPVWADNKRVV